MAGRLETKYSPVTSRHSSYLFEREESALAPDTKRSPFLRLALLVIAALVALLPLFFGGIYYASRYLAIIAVFILLAVLVSDKSKVATPDTRLIRIYFLFMGLMLAHFLLQWALLPGLNRYFDTVLSWLFVFGVVYVAFWCATRGCSATLALLFLASTFFIALVGLSHWFYDNGQLFWSFAPQAEFTSQRARWPFVNANHLGNFLLLGVFFVFWRLLELFDDFKALALNMRRRKGSIFTSLFTSHKTQRCFFQITVTAVILLVVLLSMTATLSRGTWTGLAFGILLLAALSQLFRGDEKKKPILLELIDRSQLKPKDQHRLRIRAYWLQKLWKPFLLLFATGVFLFFLNEQGQQLVEGRIEYGLRYSLDDIRWTMYHDSLSMLREHLLLGVGLGQWALRYPAYMDQSLSGLVAGYLHSEPLQLLVEVGVLAGMLVLAFCCWLLFESLRALKTADARKRRLIICCLCSLLAFLVATLVEFPLRMPAIQALFAANIGLLLGVVSECSQEKGQHRKR
jgi:O-antigen ligase